MKQTLFFLVLLVCFSSCNVYRCVRYWTADIDEYNAFPQAKIETGENKFRFHPGEERAELGDGKVIINKKDTITIDEYLSKTSTTAFLIIRNDTLLCEKYYRGYDRSTISTFFSVTKSITSLLTGIAVDEGFIRSVHDPVTDYIPELKNKDPYFRKLTIEHLLNMQAGLKFSESYSNPFSNMAKLYYGGNQLGFIEKLKFMKEPGEEYDYNSVTTAILGIVLERATGKSYAGYLEEKIWKPLGMEYDASVSLDDKKHRSAKSYGGLNATAVDLAKIGRLYLNGGNWNGKQIVSQTWIDKSVLPAVVGIDDWKKYKNHQYLWYNDDRACFSADSTGAYRFTDSISAWKFAEESAFKYYTVRKYEDKKAGYYWVVCDLGPQFYAYGIMSQILYIDPEKKFIMVRLGEKTAVGAGYNVVKLTNKLMWTSPVLEKKW
ncbi:MAG: beta-lactamase family protein [Dysgonamonadaceae bacterium]|jgi:CubicO group peptidase (beta-lactamase class C family)|nr:beta-lactamase family protein [Dysgonamonadaceae bacterium]